MPFGDSLTTKPALDSSSLGWRSDLLAVLQRAGRVIGDRQRRRFGRRGSLSVARYSVMSCASADTRFAFSA